MTRSSLLSRPSRQFVILLTCAVIAIDVILVIFSDLAAFTLRFGTDITNPPPENFFAYLQIASAIIILRVLCFYIFGFYHNLKAKTNYEIVTKTFRATTVSTIIIIVIAFYSRAFAYPRTVILLSWILSTAFLIVWHIIIQVIMGFVWKESIVTFLVIGTNKEARRIGLHLSKDASTKNKLAGYVRLPGEIHTSAACDTDMLLGDLKNMSDIIEQHSVNEVMIAAEHISPEEISSVARAIAGKDVTLKLLPGIYEGVIGNIITAPTRPGDGLSSVMISPVQTTYHWYRGLKRILDLCVSLAILFFFWPIMLLIAWLIKLTSPGPALFRQERIGMNGKRFIMYKFRTMRQGAEETSGPTWATENDSRITPLGKFLRMSRLDELPQFVFNVTKNEMSIVGPRPERPFFVEELIKEIPFYAERLSVKPGITGWAQVNYKYAGSIEESKEKLLYDIFYIKNMSLALDIWIFLKTIWTIVQEKGAQ